MEETVKHVWDTPQRESLREALVERGYEDTIMLNNAGADNAIVGITQNGALVYSYDKLVEERIKADLQDESREWDEDMSEEGKIEALREEIVEDIEYNTLRSLPYMASSGGVAPIIMYDKESFLDF